MQSELQELIAAAAEMLKCAYIEGSGWELGERLRDAIAAARASEGGWIPVWQALPENDSRIEMVDMREPFPENTADHMSVNHGDLHRWSMLAPHFTHWRLISLPSPPLSVETPEVSK